MPRKVGNCLLATLLSVCMSSAMAEGWTSPITIDSVFTEGKTDLVVIYTVGGVENAAGCVVNNWLFEADTADRRNRAYSTALAALASGKQISLWYSDLCGTWSFHKATSIKIHN